MWYQMELLKKLGGGFWSRGVDIASHNGPQKRSRMAVPSKYWLISGGGREKTSLIRYSITY